MYESTLLNFPPVVNDTAVFFLTDGADIYDVRTVHPDELGHLNQVAQTVTDGNLWWESRPPAEPSLKIAYETAVQAMSPLQAITASLETALELHGNNPQTDRALKSAWALADLLSALQERLFFSVPPRGE